jgi:methyl-accepting chemotaxis protein
LPSRTPKFIAFTQTATPNPSLERTATGLALGPLPGVVHHPSSGPSAIPAAARSAQTLGLTQHKTGRQLMLRATTRRSISELIEASYFGSQNFDLTFGEASSDLAFHVTFLPDTRFAFQVERHLGGTFSSSESPGRKFLATEVSRFDGFDAAENRLLQWLERVKQEVLATNPFSREIVELRNLLNEQLANREEELGEFFTKSEAEELSARLAAFEKRLKELSENNDELTQAVVGLSKVVADLKDASQTLNRGTWYRMAGGRLLGGLKTLVKSKEARDFALEAAKKFLLEGPK